MIKCRQSVGRYKRLVCVCSFFVALLLLAGCAPRNQAEVVERQTKSVREETEKIGGSLIRIVQPGDTLHAIAFANGQNVNDLAAWNDVTDTSALAVGQRIRLTKPIGFKPKLKTIAKSNPITQTSNVELASKPGPGNKPQPSVSASSPSKPTLSPSKSSSNDGRVVKHTPASNNQAISAWFWPTKGQLVGRFAVSSGRQGIDIQGQAGQPVVAANRGEVVYVGNGLKGYGNLVIIKHNDHYLSAYAHNRETFVQEGEKVSARHVIGSVGLDRKRRNAMHFQIRKNGKPVNPLSYLPAY